MNSNDPVTGPIPRDEFAALVALPCGEARKAIRKYDPLFGREEGEKIEWKVRAERRRDDCGTAIVKASSQEEADKLADDLTEHDFDWDDDFGDIEVKSVEPQS